ncbi:hypothetical protein FHX81_2149 [Saccharothrix saharensis]|uniref:SnoaL-like protein n=1 Tax=Saccharothrix saharensis TaxID=571190 RepID=A0A543JAI1_9PSEU|nr:hypothetical protein [Saccharothrix saharensis]TQM79838.1 hypothetical protein FHX81_2149 [Saccharothrix saharensis]
MSAPAVRGRLARAEVESLVREWHGGLARHADVAELRGRLVRSGLLLRLPGATVRDGEQFASWYRELSDSCFDQRRDVLSVEVDLVSPLHAEVTVTLMWESRRWQRPAPRSRWTGCLLTEQWLVVLQDGVPRIRTLVTTAAQPLPGSPPPLGDADRLDRLRQVVGTGDGTAWVPGTRPDPITAAASTPAPVTGSDQPRAVASGEGGRPGGTSQPAGTAGPAGTAEPAAPAGTAGPTRAAGQRPGGGDARDPRDELVAS